MRPSQQRLQLTRAPPRCPGVQSRFQYLHPQGKRPSRRAKLLSKKAWPMMLIMRVWRRVDHLLTLYLPSAPKRGCKLSLSNHHPKAWHFFQIPKKCCPTFVFRVSNGLDMVVHSQGKSTPLNPPKSYLNRQCLHWHSNLHQVHLYTYTPCTVSWGVVPLLVHQTLLPRLLKCFEIAGLMQKRHLWEIPGAVTVS